MNLPFSRLCKVATESEFRSFGVFKQLGTQGQCTIDQENIVLTFADQEQRVPISFIRSCVVVTSPVKLTNVALIIIPFILLIWQAVSNFTNFQTIASSIVMLLLLTVFFLPPVLDEKWLRIELEKGAYFYVKFSWFFGYRYALGSEQLSPLSWLLNKQDCDQAHKILVELMQLKSKERH